MCLDKDRMGSNWLNSAKKNQTELLESCSISINSNLSKYKEKQQTGITSWRNKKGRDQTLSRLVYLETSTSKACHLVTQASNFWLRAATSSRIAHYPAWAFVCRSRSSPAKRVKQRGCGWVHYCSARYGAEAWRSTKNHLVCIYSWCFCCLRV